MFEVILICTIAQIPSQPKPKQKFQVNTHFDVTVHKPKAKTCACAETGVCECTSCDCPGGKKRSDEDSYTVETVPTVYYRPSYQPYQTYQPMYQPVYQEPTVIRFVPVSDRRWVPQAVPVMPSQVPATSRSPQRPFGMYSTAQENIPTHAANVGGRGVTTSAPAPARHWTTVAQTAAPTPSQFQAVARNAVSSVAGCSASG